MQGVSLAPVFRGAAPAEPEYSLSKSISGPQGSEVDRRATLNPRSRISPSTSSLMISLAGGASVLTTAAPQAMA